MFLRRLVDNNHSNSTNKRIVFIDEIRGFLVICMVFYHAFYSMTFIFNLSWSKNLLYFFQPIQWIFAAAFIFISGFVSLFSRSNLVRGAKLLLISLAISLVTFFVIPSQAILFGVLHMLSVCMILFGILQPLLEKVSPYIGMGVCAVLFLLTLNIDKGFIGFAGLRINLPLYLYENKYLFPFGVTTKNFYSSDYFPLLPWMFIFFFGTFFSKLFKSKKLPSFMYSSHVPPLSFCGNHALIIYILHQPAILLVLECICKILKVN